MHQASVGFHCPSCVGPVAVGRRRQVHRRHTPAPSSFAHRDPIAIRVLIALNAAAFLYALSRGASLAGSLGDVGVDFGLVGFGCKAFIGQMCIGPLGVDEGEWWRLATSAFLHAGLLHVGFNMFLAWLIKVVVLRYGGVALYRKTRPFFMGMIAGHIAPGGVFLVIDHFAGMDGNVIFWG